MHMFILNPKRRWAAYEVPRCGCTLLKILTLQDNWPDFPVPYNLMHLHHNLGYSEDKSRGLVQPLETCPAGFLRFAVVRPPRDRLISLWRTFCHGSYTGHSWQLRGHALQNCSLQEFMDYVREWHNHQQEFSAYDPHLLPQRRIINLDDLDFVVQLCHLTDFLQRLGHAPFKVNASPDTPDYEDRELGDLDSLYEPYNTIIDTPKLWYPDAPFPAHYRGPVGPAVSQPS